VRYREDVVSEINYIAIYIFKRVDMCLRFFLQKKNEILRIGIKNG